MMKFVPWPLLALVLSLLPVSCSKNPAGQGGPAVETDADSAPEWAGFLPDDEIQVQGELIDIRTVYKTAELAAFPQNDKYLFSADAQLACGGNPLCAVSLIDKPGPEWVRAGGKAIIFIASEFIDLQDQDWVYTDKSFRIKELVYYIHRYTGPSQKEGVKIPRPGKTTCPVMVLGPKVTVNNPTVYGTIITKSESPRASSKINNATFVILPDGSYMASCTGSEGDSGPRMFISEDEGQTWRRHGDYSLSVNRIANMYSFFVHGGALYMMGLGDKHTNLYIVKSTDGGKTWSTPVDKKHGLILEGTFHSASVPVLVSGGRLWRTCEMYAESSTEKYPFMVSAPVGADLLDSGSWQQTEVFKDTKFKVSGFTISGMTEGNAVAGPDGTVYNFLRGNATKTSAYAARLKVTGTTGLGLAPEKYCVSFPGGGKKFTIRYDERSRRYYSLTNPDSDYPASGKLRHAGMDSDLSHSLMRNRLVLLSSEDLVNWKMVKDDVLYNPDPYFHGFQYCDWDFDGDDIVGVVRMACPEERGLPIRQHDANMLTFIRIPQFRKI